jgi:hypothetical protein
MKNGLYLKSQLETLKPGVAGEVEAGRGVFDCVNQSLIHWFLGDFLGVLSATDIKTSQYTFLLLHVACSRKSYCAW